MKVIVELGTRTKRMPCLYYETQESTMDRFPTTGHLYLPEYKLESMSERGHYVVRYNSHRVAKNGVKYAGVEVLLNEKDIRLEPLPIHGQLRAGMKP